MWKRKIFHIEGIGMLSFLLRGLLYQWKLKLNKARNNIAGNLSISVVYMITDMFFKQK